ncbi:MAG: EAL domain-containing protein [Lachnospiraceae bacterium]|nr:EAL domain-containing protein [Lachnospiraceae bacterium]
MQYNIDFEIASFIVLGILILYFFRRFQQDDLQMRFFGWFLILAIADIFLNIVSCLLLERSSVPLWLHQLVNIVYLSLQYLIPPCFVVYVFGLTNSLSAKKLPLLLVLSIPAILGVISMCLNPITGAYFYFDETGTYTHGPWHFLLYLSALFYILLTVYFTFAFRCSIEREKLLTLGLIFCTITISIVLQFLLESYMLSGFGLTLSLLLMYLRLQNPETYRDALTGLNNRLALFRRISQLEKREQPFEMVLVALDNFKIINDMFGIETGDRLIQELADQFREIAFPKAAVYRYYGDIFAFVSRNNRISSEETLEGLEQVFSKDWEVNKSTLRLTACICLFQSKLFQSNGQSVSAIIDQSILEAKQHGKGTILRVGEEISASLYREIFIKQAIARNLSNNRFEMHYQPIYDVQTGQYCSVEALARLYVDELHSYVPPDEFIRIAERDGSILDIGRLVVREVFRFIAEENLLAFGLTFVDINLSTIQFIQTELAADIIKLAEEYRIDPVSINFELTETAAIYSETTMHANIRQLCDAGFHFSLDDYGSGYSNLDYLLQIPFSNVKLDKQLVWSYFDKAKPHTILDSVVAMLSRLDKEIVAEGIETHAQSKALQKLGVRYMQGYYYSRPLPPSKLLEFLYANNHELPQRQQ